MIPNPSPSQDFPFTGYRHHSKPVDLGKLWQSFITKTAEQEAWAKVVYGRPGMSQPVPAAWQDREQVKEQVKNESI